MVEEQRKVTLRQSVLQSIPGWCGAGIGMILPSVATVPLWTGRCVVVFFGMLGFLPYAIYWWESSDNTSKKKALGYWPFGAIVALAVFAGAIGWISRAREDEWKIISNENFEYRFYQGKSVYTGPSGEIIYLPSVDRKNWPSAYALRFIDSRSVVFELFRTRRDIPTSPFEIGIALDCIEQSLIRNMSHRFMNHWSVAVTEIDGDLNLFVAPDWKIERGRNLSEEQMRVIFSSNPVINSARSIINGMYLPSGVKLSTKRTDGRRIINFNGPDVEAQILIGGSATARRIETPVRGVIDRSGLPGVVAHINVSIRARVLSSSRRDAMTGWVKNLERTVRYFSWREVVEEMGRQSVSGEL